MPDETPSDLIAEAKRAGLWLLIEFEETDYGGPSRFAYRHLDFLTDRWVYWDPQDDDGHIAPTESVLTLVGHSETSVRLVDEPPFTPGGDDDG